MVSKSILRLRVHVAPIGFEIDRILEPLIRLRADKVWLIIEDNIEENEARYYYETIKERLKNKIKIEFDERRCDINSLFELLNTYRIIIEKEENNQLFINVSTGKKIEAIAGMMAAMLFNSEKVSVVPYYVVPEDYEVKPKEGQQFSKGYKEVIQLPNYKIERPKEALIAVLKIIKENGKLSKKNLIEKLIENNLISIDKTDHTESAKYSQLNKKYLNPLLQKGFIEIEGVGKSARIKISPDGDNILKFLPK